MDELANMKQAELLEHFEGGLYALVEESEDCRELQPLLVMLGIRHFVNSRISERPREELLELFDDVERVVRELLAFGVQEGLAELDDEAE